jgi:hypothetical protein
MTYLIKILNKLTIILIRYSSYFMVLFTLKSDVFLFNKTLIFVQFLFNLRQNSVDKPVYKLLVSCGWNVDNSTFF